MTHTRGEGRSSGEKSQQVFSTAEALKARREQLKAEEEEWASKSSEVTIKRKGTE